MSHVSNNQTYSEYAAANNNPASQSEGQGYSASTSLPQDELASFLSLVERDNAYTVEAVMKKSEYEETQRVTYLDEEGHKKGPLYVNTCVVMLVWVLCTSACLRHSALGNILCTSRGFTIAISSMTCWWSLWNMFKEKR